MVRGIFWNLSGMVAIALTMLITTPLFLRYFGAERYGILATVWMVFGYFSVLDFGMGPTIVRFLSRPDRQSGAAASGVFWTAVTMNMVIGIVMGAILLVVLRAVTGSSLMPPGPIREELRQALPWLLVMFPISLIYPILVGALDSRRLFGIANGNQVAGTIAAQVLPLVAVMAVKPTLSVAVVGTILGRVLSAMLLLFFCQRRLHLGRPRFERGLVRPLLSFGGWVAISAGVGSVLETADRIVVTGLLGGVAAAWYAIAYNVVTRVRVLPHAVVRALFPQIAAERDGDALALSGAARALSLFLVPIVAMGMVLLDPLCRLWIGADAASAVVPIGQIMLLGIFANCIAFIPVVALQARGEPRKVATVHLYETPVFLVVMFLATQHFGIVGAAVSWSMRLLVDAVVLCLVTRMRRVLYIDVLMQIVVPTMAMAIAMTAPGGWTTRVALVSGVLAIWLLVDTVIATRARAPITWLTLFHAVRARIRRPRATST